jgi:hypothetical protein
MRPRLSRRLAQGAVSERNSQWAMSGETLDMTVVVMSGQKLILVTPDREFDLGVVGPDERIVRELEGTRVVNATVVKAEDIKNNL